MNARRLIEIVAEVGNDDPYQLAHVVAAEEKEANAVIADNAGQPDVAAAIRSSE